MSFPDQETSSLSNNEGSASKERALILVVERNPAVQRLEKFFLEQAGYTVEFATDGVVALERARELKPKILVTEILVPKLDGLSLCRTLKTDQNITCLMTYELSDLFEVHGISNQEVSNMSDNILLLRLTPQPKWSARFACSRRAAALMTTTNIRSRLLTRDW